MGRNLDERDPLTPANEDPNPDPGFTSIRRAGRKRPARAGVPSPTSGRILGRLHILAAAFATIALCAGAAYGDRPHVTKAMLAAFEKQFAGGVLSATKDVPFTFIDPPRAFYLDNFGIMMASEVSIEGGVGMSMFRVIEKDEVAIHHRRVIERLPFLREQMKLALFDGATRFAALDESERLAVAVTVYHFGWEDTTDIPTKIVMQGTKKALLEARAKTQDQGRDQAIQMKELF